MGSPTDLTDLSDGSIYWLLFILLSNSIKSFRRFFSLLLHSPSPPRINNNNDSAAATATATDNNNGSTAIEDQLNLNRRSSCRYSAAGSDSDESDSDDCVVCLCGLSEGELVRELDCRHVFHKGCLDGWLRRCNFTCPICRSPLLIAAEARGRGEELRG
ncbi:E3 ubiquitin-protein ligase RHA2B [Linum perenne]